MCREKTEKLLKNYIISENNMESEKVKEIKEYLRCMRGEKACWACGLNEIAENQDTCCINLVADMALDLINELESENEKLKQHKRELEGGQRDLLKVIKEFNKETQQLKDRIAELENQMCRNEDLHNATEKLNDIIILKQFTGKLIEKKIKFGDRFNIYDIDETLKEFIDNNG